MAEAPIDEEKNDDDSLKVDFDALIRPQDTTSSLADEKQDSVADVKRLSKMQKQPSTTTHRSGKGKANTERRNNEKQTESAAAMEEEKLLVHMFSSPTRHEG